MEGGGLEGGGRGARNGVKQKKCCGKWGSKRKGEVLGSVADPERFIPDPNPTIDSFQVATVLDSIPAFSDTVESEGRQMKQC
jgi:hypothetical protein